MNDLSITFILWALWNTVFSAYLPQIVQIERSCNPWIKRDVKKLTSKKMAGNYGGSKRVNKYANAKVYKWIVLLLLF
jgi:hypothetical protein